MSTEIAATAFPYKPHLLPPILGGLSTRQLAFLDHWLKTGNGTESCKVAGYNGDDNTLAVQAYTLLRSPKVQLELKRRLGYNIASADEVLEGLTAHSRADMAQVLRPDGTFDLKYAKRKGQSKLLKKLKIKKRIERDQDGNETEYIDHEIELHDAQAALNTLAKCHGLLDRVSTEDQPITVADLERAAKVNSLVNQIAARALPPATDTVEVDGTFEPQP